MNIYWYWPHPHRGATSLAGAVLRPGDLLTVQALHAYAGEALPDVSTYAVRRDLPDPARPQPGIGRRPRLVAGRLIARRRALRTAHPPFDLAHVTLLDHRVDWLQLGWIGRSTALVSTVHDVRPHQPGLPWSLDDAVLRRVYARCGEIVVAHRVLADELVADFGVERARIHLVPAVREHVDSRSMSRIHRPRPLVVHVGSIRANKGFDVLIAALRRLPPDALDVVIAGAGPPSLTTALAAAAADLANIRFEIGPVSAARKHELLAGASAVVLPYTTFHSQSSVLGDAYTYRLPVVVTGVGAIGPTVSADRTGIVVVPGDADALAGGLRQVTDAGAVDSFQPAIEVALLRSSADVVGRQLRAVYDIATERHG